MMAWVIADHYLRQRGQVGDNPAWPFAPPRADSTPRSKDKNMDDAQQRIRSAISAFARGELVIVADDDDRESEGDLFVAASLCTPKKMAFVIRHTSGIVCAPLTPEEARRLHLDPMVPFNAAPLGTRGENIEIRTTRHGIEFTSDYQNSPIQHVIETGQWLDTMLSETTDRHFPILATLRAPGITHYVMAPLVFSNRIVNAMSWATDAPGGFAEADVELFRDLVTAFVSVLEATAGRRIYGELLATYVGRDPGAQIMAGAVIRGEVHHLKAAMLLADLRGFSQLTDELPEERIVELLNAFFDLVVAPINNVRPYTSTCAVLLLDARRAGMGWIPRRVDLS